MTEGPGWATPDPQPERPAHPPPPPPQSGWGVAKPGVIPLRPLGLSEILDGAISTMRAHPKAVLGVSAIVVTISQLLTLAVTYPLLDDINQTVTVNQGTPDAEALRILGSTFAVFGLTLLITLLSRVFLSGFLTVAVGKAVLGQPVDFTGIWARVRPRLMALLGLTLVYPAVALAAAGLVVMLGLVDTALAILVLLVIVPLGIWLYILFSLATPALMLEDTRIGRAFGRSRTLVRGSWWRTFGIQLLAAIIAFIVAAIIVVPFTFLGGGFDQVTSTQPTPPTVTYLVLTTIGGIIASTITEPFAAAVIVLLYTDQRMRREGMDIELARLAGMNPPPAHP